MNDSQADVLTEKMWKCRRCGATYGSNVANCPSCWAMAGVVAPVDPVFCHRDPSSAEVEAIRERKRRDDKPQEQIGPRRILEWVLELNDDRDTPLRALAVAERERDEARRERDLWRTRHVEHLKQDAEALKDPRLAAVHGEMQRERMSAVLEGGK